MSQNRMLDHLDRIPQTIPAESVFEGDLEGSDNYIVHGRVIGNCNIDGTMMLGPKSQWKGNICADVVVVRGEVEGNITAHTKLEVRQSGRIRGELSAPIVAIAEGALHEGGIAPESCVSRYVERRNR